MVGGLFKWDVSDERVFKLFNGLLKLDIYDEIIMELWNYSKLFNDLDVYDEIVMVST
jgi:hypothetical protein